MQATQTSPWPLVVVGAGAAGITAAIFAGRTGAPCLLLDGRRHPGAKIRASGGGRCNVMPSAADVSDFFTQGSAHTLRNVLQSWPLAQMRTFFERELGLPLEQEPSGKLFPKSDDARDVVRVLFDEVRRVHGILRTEAKVTAMERVGKIWRLTVGQNQDVLYADRVIMATGGLSMPTTGSEGTGLRLAQALGHALVPTAAALVPLTGQHPTLTDLAGVSCPVQLTAVPHPDAQAAGTKPRKAAQVQVAGSMLFTHKGYSGPAVLNISQFVVGGPEHRPQATLLAAFGAPGALPPDHPDSWHQRLARAKAISVHTVVRQALPRRLADALVATARLGGEGGEGRAAALPKEDRKRLLQALTACVLPVSGSEGYRTAEVTTGGVALGEVTGRTLESRHHPGLYLCGEMLDVTGKLGGYNFMWAWASGRRAGLAAAAAYHAQGEAAAACVQAAAAPTGRRAAHG